MTCYGGGVVDVKVTREVDDGDGTFVDWGGRQPQVIAPCGQGRRGRCEYCMTRVSWGDGLGHRKGAICGDVQQRTLA